MSWLSKRRQDGETLLDCTCGAKPRGEVTLQVPIGEDLQGPVPPVLSALLRLTIINVVEALRVISLKAGEQRLSLGP